MMKKNHVFITDAKRVDPPKPEPKADPIPQAERVPRPAPSGSPPSPSCAKVNTPFDAMKASLKAGVKVVVAPQLFPTPPDIAKRMIEMAGIEKGNRILEPSAGTGNLIDAIPDDSGAGIWCVEINQALARQLENRVFGIEVKCANFLDVSVIDTGSFDRVVMNPPFENGSDVKHVEHALTFLHPGGRLVAIVAGGPRQEKAFKHRASEWEELPSGTFAGTEVRAVLMAIDKEG